MNVHSHGWSRRHPLAVTKSMVVKASEFIIYIFNLEEFSMTDTRVVRSKSNRKTMPLSVEFERKQLICFCAFSFKHLFSRVREASHHYFFQKTTVCRHSAVTFVPIQPVCNTKASIWSHEWHDNYRESLNKARLSRLTSGDLDSSTNKIIQQLSFPS